MFHKHRTWQAPKDVTDLTPEEFAELLTQHTWTTCSAWYRGNVAYFNDSTCEDGAFEVAVVALDKSTHNTLSGNQFESVTFGWCTPERAAEYIRRYDTGDMYAEPAVFGYVTARVHPADTYCPACA